MDEIWFILLQVTTGVSVVVAAAYAMQTAANPKLITGGRATAGVRLLAFLACARTIVIGAAAFGTMVLGARQAFVWIAGITVVLQLLDSLQGQVQNDPGRTLAPLGVGLLQLVLLLVVIQGGVALM
jgi:hypothetical protein